MALTEREILDCLKENLRIAAERMQDLADGKRGKAYGEFRDACKLVDGCCRQMTGWREDTRWGPFGMYVRESWLRVGKWLREDKKSWRPKFLMMADIFRGAITRADELERKRVGRLGMVLPPVQPAPTRTHGRQILVPDGYKDIRNKKAAAN